MNRNILKNTIAASKSFQERENSKNILFMVSTVPK
jgi:hypothetical protein